MDSDFSTTSGPDVQILLNTDTTTVNSLMVVDIGTTDGINHFNGAITFNVPNVVSLESSDHIIFHCVQFNVSWANGDFGPVIDNITSIEEELHDGNKELVYIVNLQGQPRSENTINELLIYRYSDGSVEKRVNVE